MPRKNIPISPLHPYHIRARTNKKEVFPIPLEEVWEIMEVQLYFLHHAFGIHIHSFVLMANHFHLIASSPKANLPEAMNYFMRETSREILRRAGLINHLYGGNYRKTLIDNWHYYQHAYKYVYRNPVEVGISTLVEDYKFSTLGGLLGLKRLIVPVCEDTLLIESPTATLQWLNTAPTPENYKAVRAALKKTIFSIGSPRGGNRRPNPLITSSY